MKFELTNDQRLYFGLEPIKPEWDRVILKGDTYREESILYFEGDCVKRHIVSTDFQYKENQYNDLTRDRTLLLPATSKGKEKKLTASVLESRQPTGLYCSIDSTGRVLIGNFNTQTTFYDSFWEHSNFITQSAIKEHIDEFIKTAPDNYLSELAEFKKQKRKNIKFKVGDFFAFKINRVEYGFGRILLNVDELKTKGLVSKDHGLGRIMAKPVLVKIYAYTSKVKDISIGLLENITSLPSDYMMDNLLFYGEYEIIGHKELRENELDFPMSYGRHTSALKQCSFLQWGLIHRELSTAVFNNYFYADNPFAAVDSPSRKVTNPYGYYSIGFRPRYSSADIKDSIKNKGRFDYNSHSIFRGVFDLRNPDNSKIRAEIMKAFGLDPTKNYGENCKLTKTMTTLELLKRI